MRPYYILQCDLFDTNREAFYTPSQGNLGNISNRKANSLLRKRDGQVIDNFLKYDLTCEIPQIHKGRAYGVDEIFESFILIEEELFYYNEPCRISIFSCSKEIFNRFIHDFSDPECFSYIKFNKLNVDFKKIVNNQKSSGVEGVWFGDTGDVNVEHMYLLGNRVETSDKYEDLLASGATIKNLTIIYKYNGDRQKIMITRNGGIILYRSLEETDALALVLDVYQNLLC